MSREALNKSSLSALLPFAHPIRKAIVAPAEIY
jgi:hypothetical protein